MSNYKIVVKNEDINEVNNTLKLAQKYHNQFKILKAYKLYKYLYRICNIFLYPFLDDLFL